MTKMRDRKASEPSAEVAELIAEHKLRRAGARPNIVQYTRDIWGRRHFLAQFSTANNAVGYSDSLLGQAWQLLTPLLNVLVYFLIFGVLIDQKRSIHNYTAFLVIGIFVFTYTQTAMMGGARSIAANIQLTRVLHFPRAVMPLSSTLIALQRLLFSLVIMIPVVLITGEPLEWRWLYLIPAIALQSLFCLGLAFVVARIGASVPDTSQVLPFILRTWMYTSGVMFSITNITAKHAHWVKVVLEVNPAAVYIELVREALLTRQPPATPYVWQLAAGWGVLALALGYVYFWRAEESYGRV